MICVFKQNLEIGQPCSGDITDSSKNICSVSSFCWALEMSEHLQSLGPFLLRRRELKWTRFKNSAPPLTFIQMTTKSRLDRLPGELIFTRTHWIIFKQLSGMNQRFSLWWEKISFHLWQFGLHFCGWRPNHPCCGKLEHPQPRSGLAELQEKASYCCRCLLNNHFTVPCLHVKCFKFSV